MNFWLRGCEVANDGKPLSVFCWGTLIPQAFSIFQYVVLQMGKWWLKMHGPPNSTSKQHLHLFIIF